MNPQRRMSRRGENAHWKAQNPMWFQGKKPAMNPQAPVEAEFPQDLFDLPEGWEMRPLMHALSPVDMKCRSEIIQPEQQYHLLTVRLYAKGVTLRSQVKGSQIGVAKLFRTQPNDFVVSKIDARNGAWGFIPDNLIGGMVSNDFPLFQLRPENADPDFLTFLLSQSSARRPLLEHAIGSTGRRRVQVDDFLLLEFPFPPLPEQQAIAAALRAARRARDATANVLEQTRELKRSLLRHLFTYGPVSVQDAAKVELQETEIGMIPADWEVTTFQAIARVGNGSTPKRDHPEYWKNGNFPWLNSGKVNEGRIYRAEQFVTSMALKECHLPHVPSGSVLVAITGQGKTLGTVAITGIDASVNQHIAYINFVNSELHSEYAYQYLKTQYQNFRKSAGAGGSTKAALTCAYIKKYPFPMPSKMIIQEITKILRVADKCINFAEFNRDSSVILINSMLRDLLTGRIRVPIPAPTAQATPQEVPA